MGKILFEHSADMRKEDCRTKSGLSAHIWNLKDKGMDFNFGWRLNATLKKCRICLKEKFRILYKAEGASLNRRS